MALVLVFSSVAAPADTYPKNPNLDVLHYRFELLLSDASDGISGVTTVQVRFLTDGVTEFELEWTFNVNLHFGVRAERARDHILGHIGGDLFFGRLPGSRHFPDQAMIESELLAKKRQARSKPDARKTLPISISWQVRLACS